MVNKLLFFGLCGVLLHATVAKAADADFDDTPLNLYENTEKEIDSSINSTKTIEEKKALLRATLERMSAEIKVLSERLSVKVTRLSKQMKELIDQREKKKRQDVVTPQKRPAERACDKIKNGLRTAGLTHSDRYPDCPFRFFNSATEISKHCMGALIDKRFILILADCWSEHYIMQIRLCSSAESKRIKAIHRHGHFTKSTRSDIILIELDSDVNYSPDLYPVCLYTSQLDPEILRHRSEKIQLVANAECEKAFNTKIERFEACAKVVQNTFARTGELIHVEKEGFPKYQLFGVTIKSGLDDKLYLTAKVFDHLDFIERTVWPQYAN